MRSFEEWFKELQGFAAKHKWPVKDPRPWLDYFKEGYSPEDALYEEMSYGD